MARLAKCGKGYEQFSGLTNTGCFFTLNALQATAGIYCSPTIFSVPSIVQALFRTPLEFNPGKGTQMLNLLTSSDQC